MKKEVKKRGWRRVASIICTVLTVVIFVLAVYLMINVIIAKVKNKPAKVFGTSIAIVLTGSMEPEISEGELIVFTSVDYDDIKVGDNLVFSSDENFTSLGVGKTVVHKVVEITEDGIKTKGVNNSVNDGGLREKSEIYGVCTYHSLGWGKFFSFLSKWGIPIIILVVALPFIVKQIVKIAKFANEGVEEKAAEDYAKELDAERERIKKELEAEIEKSGAPPQDDSIKDVEVEGSETEEQELQPKAESSGKENEERPKLDKNN